MTDEALTVEHSGKGLILQALETACRDSAEARFLHRLHCVLLVLQGCSGQEVAEWHAADPSSVARWVRRFDESGLEGLREGRRSGRPGKLGSKHLQALGDDLSKPPDVFGYAKASWNGTLLAAHLKQQYGVSLSVRQCQRLLRQLTAPNPRPNDAAAPSK